MQRSLLALLACSACQAELSCTVAAEAADEEILRGELQCRGCGQSYPIEGGIPRFVERQNYASSFGYQWNEFKREQLDSSNGTQLSTRRFQTETGWSPEWLAGKWVLEGGCGAGRFIEVASRSDCQVVGVDLSNAVDAVRQSLAGRRNVHLVQASIYDLPFRSGVFDGCYSIGVIQHTPDPPRALEKLTRVLKPGGRLAVTIYERKPWTLLYAKYWWRPLTRRLKPERLLQLLKAAMPVLFPVTEVLFRIPQLGRVFMFLIPVANYVHETSLTRRQRYDWALLDTFDMLAPAYDQPQTQSDTERVLHAAGMTEVRRLNNPGLNLVGRKA